MLKDEPSLHMPYALSAEPRRTKLRKLRDDPKPTKSSTLRDEPRRLMPYADKLLPTRTKLRKLIVLPRRT
jgi:hypothetical protein